MNPVLETIANRSSCRAYTGAPVEREKIEALLKAGLQSPSALNKQPWHLIAITDKELIDRIDGEVMNRLAQREDQSAYERVMERGGKPYYNAPVMILILEQESVGGWTANDIGIVSENIALAATSLGLGNVIAAMCGTAFTEGENAQQFRDLVKWPAGYKFGLGVLVGYAEKTKEPHEIDMSKITII